MSWVDDAITFCGIALGFIGIVTVLFPPLQALGSQLAAWVHYFMNRWS